MQDELKHWGAESRVSDDVEVIRIVPRKKPFFDPPGADKPLPHEAFRITASDEDEGRKRGLQPLLSVWNGAMVSLANAKSRLTSGPSTGYVLSVAEIHRLPPAPVLFAPVTVHHDPDELPFGTAHCGIQGLHRPPKAAKMHIQNVRASLLDICRRHPDEA